jgi:hypothetical protein
MAAQPMVCKTDPAVYTASGAGVVTEISAVTISWAELVAAGMGAGDEIVLVLKCGIGHSDFAAHAYLRAARGTTFAGRTDWSNSYCQKESDFAPTDRNHTYQWMERHTLVVNENLYVGLNAVSSGTSRVADLAFWAISVEGLTEGVDFLWADEAHSGDADHTGWETDGAEITVPGDSDDWLILGHSNWLIDSTSADFGSSLYIDGATVCFVEDEGEDAAEIRNVGHIYVHEQNGSATTARVQYRTWSISHDCERTAIFGLRLGVFRDHEVSVGSAIVTCSVLNTWYEAQGVGAYVHGGSGANDLMIVGATYNSTQKGHIPFGRIQVDGSDFPVAGMGVNSSSGSFTSTSLVHAHQIGKASFSPGTLDIDFDVSEDWQTAPPYDEHYLVAFSTELAGAGPGPGPDPEPEPTPTGDPEVRRGLVTMGQILAIHDVDCEWRVLLVEQVVPITEES